MTLEQINKTIEDYQRLEDLIEEKLLIMSKVDSQYNIYNGIDNLFFCGGVVTVYYSITNCGYTSEEALEFPIEWLSKPDEELEAIILSKKEEKQAEKERKEKEHKEKELKEKEERERIQYERLKKKYEP